VHFPFIGFPLLAFVAGGVPLPSWLKWTFFDRFCGGFLETFLLPFSISQSYELTFNTFDLIWPIFSLFLEGFSSA